jgi:hypothetical protein
LASSPGQGTVNSPTNSSPVTAVWNGYRPDARVHHFADARAAWLAKLDEPRYVEAAG